MQASTAAVPLDSVSSESSGSAESPAESATESIPKKRGSPNESAFMQMASTLLKPGPPKLPPPLAPSALAAASRSSAAGSTTGTGNAAANDNKSSMSSLDPYVSDDAGMDHSTSPFTSFTPAPSYTNPPRVAVADQPITPHPSSLSSLSSSSSSSSRSASSSSSSRTESRSVERGSLFSRKSGGNGNGKKKGLHDSEIPRFPPGTRADCIFKIVLLGDPTVGKSSIMSRILGNEIKEAHVTTVGVDLGSKPMRHIDGRYYKLQIWDTAGQDRFRSITRAYYRGVHACLFVYDVTEPKSFAGIEQWRKDLEAEVPGDYSNMSMFIVGNKIDLKNQVRVSLADVRPYAEQHRMQSWRVSCKLPIDEGNVRELFAALFNDLLSKATPVADFPRALDLNHQNTMPYATGSSAGGIKSKCC